ncbi:MAG: hypothetical protein P4K98_10800, partial [Bryobacteraceae bacterium]|nr:hypothetical protein [Bryobacteraceae bacterium]
PKPQNPKTPKPQVLVFWHSRHDPQNCGLSIDTTIMRSDNDLMCYWSMNAAKRLPVGLPGFCCG